MNTLLSTTSLSVLALCAIPFAETVKGAFVGADREGVKIKVDGGVKTFAYAKDGSTRFLDADGKEHENLLQNASIPIDSFKGVPITLETKPDGTIAWIRLPIRLVTTTTRRTVPLTGDALAEVRASSFIGKPLPNFTMTTTKGAKITNASLKGKVVVIDFWATWCKPCVMLEPVMKRIQSRYAAKGVTVIGANVLESGDARILATKHARAHGITYPVTYGGDALLRRLGQSSIPLLLVVDRAGIVRGEIRGYSSQTESQLASLLAPLVSKK